MFCMLSISQATLHGHLKDFNLEISHSFSTIDNDTLDGIVRSIKEAFPNNGYRMVWGHLKEGDWLFSSPVLEKGYYELTLRVLCLHGFTSQIEKNTKWPVQSLLSILKDITNS